MKSVGAALAVVAVLAVAPTVVNAARPDPGKYRGKTSQGRPLDARVTSSRRGLQLRFPDKFSCTGVSDKLLKAIFVKQRPTIKADGTFRYRKSYSRLRLPDFPGPFSETQSITGRFTDGLRRLRARSSTRITGKGFSCRSTVMLRAKR